MKFLKNTAMFTFGGVCYVALELLWRGHSHSSMFFAGGSCFLLLGRLGHRKKISLPLKALLGAGIITGVEFITGLMVNRNYSVWDYRTLPLNLLGQICLPFSLLWMPISLAGMFLYRQMDRLLPGSDR